MAEKPKDRNCKLVKLDRVIGLFAKNVDEDLSTDEKISEIAYKILELLYQEGVIDEEGGEEINLEALVCRVLSKQKIAEERADNEKNTLMDWMSDLSVDHSVQSARESEAIELFKQSQRGEIIFDDLKEALVKMFEETEDSTPQMSIDARIEMNQRRLEKTAEAVSDDTRGLVEDIVQRPRPFEGQDKALWGETEMKHFLAGIALSNAQKQPCQSGNKHEQAQ